MGKDKGLNVLEESKRSEDAVNPRFRSAMLESAATTIRDQICREGPMPFAGFMEAALYHPHDGYYSSGRCEIGRKGDYFTSVSVGPLFGQLLAAQFVQIWRSLDRRDDFVIVEQGAHNGILARDILEALTSEPEFFAAMKYRIVEPFAPLRERQMSTLAPFLQRVEWVNSLVEMRPFRGIYFANELLDSLPVHLVRRNSNGEWRERYVALEADRFVFTDGNLSNSLLRDELERREIPPGVPWEIEINLGALNLVDQLAGVLSCGVALISDYGYTRSQFTARERSEGTLRAYAQHRLLSSPLDCPGAADLSAHVDWTRLAERAEQVGMGVGGFADQHHFITGMLAGDGGLAKTASRQPRALQTLLHPELLGTRFQVLGLMKNATIGLSGFRFATGVRKRLGLSK